MLFTKKRVIWISEYQRSENTTFLLFIVFSLIFLSIHELNSFLTTIYTIEASIVRQSGGRCGHKFSFAVLTPETNFGQIFHSSYAICIFIWLSWQEKLPSAKELDTRWNCKSTLRIPLWYYAETFLFFDSTKCREGNSGFSVIKERNVRLPAVGAE